MGASRESYMALTIFLLIVISSFVYTALVYMEKTNDILRQDHLRILISELKKLNKVGKHKGTFIFEAGLMNERATS